MRKKTYSTIDYSVKTDGLIEYNTQVFIDEESAYLAVSIYQYLLRQSSTTIIHLFRHIINEILTFSIALSEEKRREQLAVSIVRNSVLIDDTTIESFYKNFTTIKSDEKRNDFVNAFRNGDYHQLSTLIVVPEKQLFVNVLSAFRPARKALNEEEFSFFVNKVNQKLLKIAVKGLDTKSWKDAAWCFTPLSYLSVFEKWLNNEDVLNPFEFYFFNLYIKGKALDYILDYIFSGDLAPIRYRLLRTLEDTCRNNTVFCEYVQLRYDTLKKIHYDWPNKHFYYTLLGDGNEKEISALAPILQSCKKNSPQMTEQQMKDIYEKLSDSYISCSFDDFLFLFSGKKTDKIIWYKKANTLAAFLMAYSIYQNEYSNIKEIAVVASKIFIINNKVPSASTLSQKPNEFVKRGFENMFKQIVNS